MKLQLVAPRQGLAWVRRAFQVFVPPAARLRGAVRGLPVRVPAARPDPARRHDRPARAAARRLAAVHDREPPRRRGRTADAGAIVELRPAGRARLLALLKLGIAYGASTSSSSGSPACSTAARSMRFFDLAARREDDARIGRRARSPIRACSSACCCACVFAGALSIPFWHAPALVYWGGQGWAKSLFFSTVALWRNKGAFALYGLGWLALWHAAARDRQHRRRPVRTAALHARRDAADAGLLDRVLRQPLVHVRRLLRRGRRRPRRRATTSGLHRLLTKGSP